MKILFVCGKPPHPLHEAFARSINADFFYAGNAGFRYILSSLNKLPKGYDIYLTEGLFAYVSLCRKLGFVKKSAKIINIFSDPRLYQLKSGERFCFSNHSIKKYSFLKNYFLRYLVSSVDGGICVGKFEQNLLKSVAPNVPSRSVEPYINDLFFNLRLPDYGANNILFIGSGPDFNYKGLDFLIELLGDVRGKCANKDKPLLYVVGGKWDVFQKTKSLQEGVVFLGDKSPEEIIKISKNCSVYCHFGRGEAYGLVVLEAMAMGLLPVISNLTGAKEAVEAVNLEAFPFRDKQKIVDTICKYFNNTKKQKTLIGRTCRDYVKKFNKTYSLASFKSNFLDLVKEISENEKT